MPTWKKLFYFLQFLLECIISANSRFVLKFISFYSCYCYESCSSVSIVTMLRMIGDSRVRYSAKAKSFHFTTATRQAPRPIQPSLL